MTLQEILFYASVVMFALAAICIVVAVVIFFTRDIPGIRNYLTGKTLREAAERGLSSGRSRRKAPTAGGATGEKAAPGSSGSLETQSGPIRQVNTVTPEHSRQRAVAEARDRENAAKSQAQSASGGKTGGKTGGSRKASKGAAAASAAAASAAAATDSDATTILDDGTNATTILETVDEGSGAQERATGQAAEASSQGASVEKKAHEGFEVVRKVVLTASTSVVSAD